MYKYEITKRIEEFAPLETQEEWDCSGWAVNIDGYDDIHKVMLCLTVTDNVIKQAKAQNCDMIVSHHPMFCIPTKISSSPLWGEGMGEGLNIYCAHTNMDKAHGGTTDTLINVILNLFQDLSTVQNGRIFGSLCKVQQNDFLRIVQLNNHISVSDFSEIIRQISPNARIINNKGAAEIKRIAFCAGSGSEFINDAKELGADCFVTGDLKFHTALESEIVVYDIGHFESEILILPVFEKIIGTDVEIVRAQESSPFIHI